MPSGPAMSPTFSRQYRDTVAALARPLKASDRTPADALSRAERRLGVRLPGALREYYRACGRFGPLNRAHDRLIAPEKLFVDSGKLVFLEENQWVVYWGVEAASERRGDPPVFQGVNVID